MEIGNTMKNILEYFSGWFPKNKEQLIICILVTADTLDKLNLKVGKVENMRIIEDLLSYSLGFFVSTFKDHEIKIKTMTLGREPNRHSRIDTLVKIQGHGHLQLLNVKNRIDLKQNIHRKNFENAELMGFYEVKAFNLKGNSVFIYQ